MTALEARLARDTKLIIAARAGSKAASDEMFMNYDALVMKTARKHYSRELTHDDLVQEDRLGLLRAMSDWDPSRGVQFITYAANWIRCRILQAVLPSHLHSREANKVVLHGARVAERLRAELRRDPTDEEVAAGVGVQVQYVELAKNRAVSLQAPYPNTKITLEGTLADPLERADHRYEREQEERARRQIVLDALGRLSSRERAVLTARFMGPQDKDVTLQQVGDRMGISRERVRQIQERAFEKIAPALKAVA